MRARTAMALAAALLGLLVAVVLGTGGGVAGAGAAACAGAAPQVVEVSTFDDPEAASSGVVVSGYARVEERNEFVAWFEYRPVGYVEWRATDRRKVPTNSCGQAWFEATLSDLEANTTYEYRAVVSTGDDTARGNVSRFRTGAATATPVGTEGVSTAPTATPDPCPTFRGVGSLCTTTPTPSPHDGPDVTPAAEDDVRDVGPGRDRGLLAWVAGVVPLVAWVAAVTVVAPLVLAGLVGVDSLRGRR